MAMKGQVFKKYTDEEREKIVLEFINGKGSYQYLASKFNVSNNTIKTWVRKYRIQGTTLQLKPKGRPKAGDILSEIERLKLENNILKKFQAFLNQQLEKK